MSSLSDTPDSPPWVLGDSHVLEVMGRKISVVDNPNLDNLWFGVLDFAKITELGDLCFQILDPILRLRFTTPRVAHLVLKTLIFYSTLKTLYVA
jgi:hypothetical protein